MFSWHWRKLVAPTLLACILLYAVLLRLDALFKSYGPYDHPRWLAAMQPSVRAAGARLTPDWQWRRVAEPYVGGDPINYLKFAREMRHFYAAHVREPMFPAATRLGLMLTDDADVGVSITSIAFALLTLVATYALGSQVASPAAGLAAAAALALDQSAVGWSIGGWRDELFAFFAISCAWAWIRFHRRPGNANAVIAGVLSGGACLTRITSIALVAPAIIWLLATHSLPRRNATRQTARRRDIRRPLGLAIGIMTALVAPFLINCAIATGDPLYAINNHTDFYLRREGAPVTPISAVSYSIDKFRARPIAAMDNAMLGVVVYPFSNKWVGLDEWLPGLGTTLACLAIAGLVAWLFQPEGRLLVAMFFGSLVPFSMTWTVLGGAEWRLTLFAYAFYLVAAFWLVDRSVRLVRATKTHGIATTIVPNGTRAALRPIAIVLAMLAFGVVWTFAMPYAVAREALTTDAPATIMARHRDRWFFADGWSGPRTTGNVTTRSTTEAIGTLELYFPDARAYELILRIDPADPVSNRQQKVRVSLGEHKLDDLDLTWNPERIGEYRLSIPAGIATPGVNRLVLHSDANINFWYLRVIPQ
ncbi:MAG TPA: glycosyltransferase family 39 protein [Vicinamibacterales bacterium]|nr:glycosyltransferase family 39 protein [Vicinamibacterales bacterium]